MPFLCTWSWYLPPLVKETEAHRRQRLLAEGNFVEKERKLIKVEVKLTRTKAKFAKVHFEDAVAMNIAEKRSHELIKAKCDVNKVIALTNTLWKLE